MPRSILFIFLALAVLFPAGVTRGEMEPADSPDLAQMVAQGDVLAAAGHFDKALDSYRKADKFAKHGCAACHLRIFDIDLRLGDLSAALDDAKRAEMAAQDNKVMAIQAHMNRAVLLADMAGKPSDKKLKESEEEIRAALAIEPSLKTARFELGSVLLKQGRDAEGVAELKTFVATRGADPKNVAEALRDIANPRLAREPQAPDFSFSSFDGGKISSDALRGKVVLLDFWATWCPPCRESVPTLLRLRQKYAGRPFEIVGISADNDQQAWQTFINAHHMDWPDHFDGGRTIAGIFAVRVYPTYIVVDRDGVMRFRQSGYNPTTDADLMDSIDKALKRPLLTQAPAGTAEAPHAQN